MKLQYINIFKNVLELEGHVFKKIYMTSPKMKLKIP